MQQISLDEIKTSVGRTARVEDENNTNNSDNNYDKNEKKLRQANNAKNKALISSLSKKLFNNQKLVH